MTFNYKKLGQFIAVLSLCLASLQSVFAQDDVILYIDNIDYTVDPDDPTLFTIPVRVQNFTGIAGVDFTITATNMNTQILDVMNGNGIPPNSLTVNILNPTTVSGIFLDFSGTGVILNDNDIFFELLVQLPVDTGDCFPFEFNFLEVVKADNPGFEAPSQGLGAEICLLFEAAVSGFVVSQVDLQNPIDSKSINIFSADNTYVDTTDVVGFYNQSVPTNTNYAVFPLDKIDEITKAQRLTGINVGDLVVIIRHLLSLELFSSPYQYLAADVDGDDLVGLQDLILIQSFILGKIDEWPGGIYWNYVPASYVFPNPNDPFDAPIPEVILLEPLTGDVIDATFVGIRLGDANLSSY